MKKSLLLASMAALSLSAVAQGLDATQYEAKEGYVLTNNWLMSRGDNGVSTAVAYQDWLDLESKAANAGKATMAAMLGDYIYVSCNQDRVPSVDENTGEPIMALEHYSHLLVYSATTGKFVKDMPLTLNGARYGGLLAANWIGTDNAGHLLICSYVQPCYDAATGIAKPMNLYLVNVETGELTLLNAFEFDEIEGPMAAARVDYYDVAGDVVNGPAAFMAVPCELAAAYVWVKEEGDEWGPGSMDFNVLAFEDTFPTGQTAWNYSPMGSFVYDDSFDVWSLYMWMDGHCTKPALYDDQCELMSSFATVSTEAEEGGAWEEFYPVNTANGVRQFQLGDDQFLVYAVAFPDDSNLGGQMAIVKLGENLTLEGATPLWTAPAAKLGIKKGEGRFSHSYTVGPVYEDENGKLARDIMLYKDCNGLGVYTIAQEGFVNGVNNIEIEENNAPVEYFNLNGVRVQGELVPGLYIKRQGTEASKVVVR